MLLKIMSMSKLVKSAISFIEYLIKYYLFCHLYISKNVKYIFKVTKFLCEFFFGNFQKEKKKKILIFKKVSFIYLKAVLKPKRATFFFIHFLSHFCSEMVAKYIKLAGAFIKPFRDKLLLFENK